MASKLALDVGLRSRAVGALLSAVSIILYLIVLCTGLIRLEFGRYFQAFVSLAGLAVLGATIYFLGWPGVFILASVSAVAFVVRAVMLAVQREAILVSAQVHGAFGSREEALAFPKALRRSHRALRYIGPIELSRLIERLAKRGRRAEEIQAMAAPIVMLHVAFKSELTGLVDRFDRLLRLWGKEAAEAGRAADVLTKGAISSAATFDEMLDAMISVAAAEWHVPAKAPGPRPGLARARLR